MPKINTRVGRTVTIVAVIVALFGWRKVDMGRLEAGIAQLRADIADLRDGMARPEAGQATTGERMARIEGAVAVALGRTFPGNDRVARTPDTDESAAN